MEIRVLGKSNAWQDAGGASSGYLLSEDGYKVLLDCGSGVFGKLRTAIDHTEVDAIVISHLHADHMLDLIPFSFALKYTTRTGMPRPLLWAPPGARELFRGLGDLIGFGDQIESAFELHEYELTSNLQVGPFSVRFCEVPHYVQTFAADYQSADGKRFTFGADCGPNLALEEFAHGTDLLAVEATFDHEPEVAPDDILGHMTPRQAGALAAQAQAKRVFITHFSDELDAAWVASEARAGFGGQAEVAHEGAVYTV